MSKPSNGSALHPHPRYTSISPKPKLPPRIPQHVARPQQENHKVAIEPSEAHRVTEAASTRTLWETIVRRKKLFGAVAFTVVAVTGALFGARLKETWQEYVKRQEFEETAKKMIEANATATIEDVSPVHNLKALQNSTTEPSGAPISTTKYGSSTYSVDVAKQIALLEDRKALLNRHKANLEQKIAKMKERKARREEMESRRPQSNEINR